MPSNKKKSVLSHLREQYSYDPFIGFMLADYSTLTQRCVLFRNQLRQQKQLIQNKERTISDMADEVNQYATTNRLLLQNIQQLENEIRLRSEWYEEQLRIRWRHLQQIMDRPALPEHLLDTIVQYPYPYTTHEDTDTETVLSDAESDVSIDLMHPE